jgi:L-lysine 4-chlorinase
LATAADIGNITQTPERFMSKDVLHRMALDSTSADCGAYRDLKKFDSTVLEQIDTRLDDHYRADSSLSSQYFSTHAEQLSRESYTKVSEILPADLKAQVFAEVIQLMNEKSRRIDITVAVTGNSPRKMETINYENITEGGVLVPHLYYSRALRGFLCKLTRHHVYDCPYDSERMTGTRQTRVGDTHGWHWGDHQYALIFIVEAPDISAGGMLQCVPHTTWDKANPRIHEIIAANSIRTYHHTTGDIYFFKTDTNLHRTYPLERDCTRIILNFTYSGPDDLVKSTSHETMSAIYDF